MDLRRALPLLLVFAACSTPESSTGGSGAAGATAGGEPGDVSTLENPPGSSGAAGAAAGGEPGDVSAPESSPGSGGAGGAAAGGEPGDVSAPETSPGGGGAGGAAAGGEPGNPVELPPGSREYEGVVNLVDADAASEVAEYLSADSPAQVAYLQQNLTTAVNLFLERYLEEYDFLILVHAGPIQALRAYGSFETINSPAMRGNGQDLEIALGGYRTGGRLRGAVALPYLDNFYPPMAHELTHYWAVHLDERFGFGQLLNEQHVAHWGASGVHGQLGGFDDTTLRCETPAGALPPDCEALGSGRTRYVVDDFAPNANGTTNVPYAPMELYLMGLLPASDVPDSIAMLVDAEIDYEARDSETGTVTVEAAELTYLPFSDIVARHGEVEPLAEQERAFTAAFVVVSAEPAGDEILTEVARWAAIFGNRRTEPGYLSFEQMTGGRATIDTELGRRRDESEPPPAIRERWVCSPLAQDCGDPALGCYTGTSSYCALVGSLGPGDACDYANACAAGLNCVRAGEDPTPYCMPYCDLEDSSSGAYCITLCNGWYMRLEDSTTGDTYGNCLPGDGP